MKPTVKMTNTPDKHMDLKPTGVIVWYTPHNHMMHGSFNIDDKTLGLSHIGYDDSLQLHPDQTMEDGLHLMEIILKRRVSLFLSSNSSWKWTRWMGNNIQWITILNDKIS